MIKVNNINNLPIIIIKKIISLITNNKLSSSDYYQISLINKLWNRYSRETIYFIEFHDTEIPNYLTIILSRFKSTLSLKLKQCIIKISYLSKLIENLNNLLDLEISYCILLNDDSISSSSNSNNIVECNSSNNNNNNLLYPTSGRMIQPNFNLKGFINKLNNSGLNKLILEFNQIDNKVLSDLTTLIELPNYFKINLTINLITSNNTLIVVNEIMKKSPTILNSLDLNRCKVGRDLNTFNIFSNEIIRFNQCLVKLDLSYNQLSDSAAIILATGLSENKSIQSLNLSFNDIKKQGSISIANSIAVNKSIKTFQFTCNSPEQDGMIAFSEMIKSNSTLTELNLSNNKISLSATIGKMFKESLVVNKSLKILNLSRNSIDNQGAEYIANGLSMNSSLIQIDLSSNRISNLGAIKLSKSIAFNCNTKLDSINLSSNCIEDSGAASFSDIVLYNKTVTHLDLSINWINSNGVIELMNSFIANLSSSITSLDFECNTICSLGALAIGKALAVNCSLKNINLFSNNLDVVGAQELSKSSFGHSNQNLTSLCLSGNGIGNDGVISLVNQLIENKSIKSIGLSQSLINSLDGVEALVNLIKLNSTIEFLDLSYNSIGAKGAQEIATALFENKTITSLDLSSNSIGDLGATAISKVFTNNNILTRLSLYNNKIGSIGATAIVDQLIKNHSLYSINLLSNNIDTLILKPILKRLEHLLPKN